MKIVADRTEAHQLQIQQLKNEAKQHELDLKEAEDKAIDRSIENSKLRLEVRLLKEHLRRADPSFDPGRNLAYEYHWGIGEYAEDYDPEEYNEPISDLEAYDVYDAVRDEEGHDRHDDDVSGNDNKAGESIGEDRSSGTGAVDENEVVEGPSGDVRHTDKDENGYDGQEIQHANLGAGGRGTPPDAPDWMPVSEPPQAQCLRCDWLDRCSEDESENSLRSRSRLMVREFYDTAAGKCFVPIQLQFHVLKRALRLGQEALWHALHEHMPHIQLQAYPEGPEEVKFGTTELWHLQLHYRYRRNTRDECYSFERLPVGINDLRNLVCHPFHVETARVDELVRSALSLAVGVQDEDRAMQIRQLRDDLEAEATRTFQQIEAGVDWAALPYAEPWPLHIQRMFASMCFNFYSDERVLVGIDHAESVIRAAREWQRKHGREPGTLDPDYLRRMEVMKSFMRPPPDETVIQKDHAPPTEQVDELTTEKQL